MAQINQKNIIGISPSLKSSWKLEYLVCMFVQLHCPKIGGLYKKKFHTELIFGSLTPVK